MPHSPARPSRTVLVTGFGAFPGVPRNPTETLVGLLRRERSRFARIGVDLRCEVIPVRFEGCADRLDGLIERHRPDAILHLGVASRRRRISVETRAVNRANPLRPDEAGHCPGHVLVAGGPATLRTTYPAGRILAALVRKGCPAERSIDTGDYVCNATLYRSLVVGAVREAGFVHLPKPRGGRQRLRASGTPRPSMAELARAVRIVALAMVRAAL